ncbi:EamA family transporter [Actinomycetospora cinnamomea]|uniref:Threonine/homoserine efflux transporter RhtA n=1 Tax=Actinomycetospora cinnamomea TaxID=663609 RepID=A0A2U1FQZ8_9PSEU|nr:EamA family transporter [Actinomycetospora cinnamomea]PVZ14597.1 threonine/homoserine efflux transporter RhtA [Actinomycetospora cinnamomea]
MARITDLAVVARRLLESFPVARVGSGQRAARTAPGLAVALVSGASFGMAGPFAASLLATGWSPLAVVLGRLGGAALLLAVPLALLLARGWRPRAGHLRAVAVYGLVPLAGAQVCYFSAVGRLSVGVALLIEYTAPVLLLGWTWARTGLRPRLATLLGAVLAIAGLGLVLDVGRGADVDVVGVLWGLGAAVCLAAYFRLSAAAGGGREGDPAGPPALVLVAGGAAVGSAVVVLVGAVGLLPLEATAAPIELGGATAPWWVGVLLVATLSTALAYLTGIAAVGRLGSRLASFVGLSEVLFAVLGAWWLVAQRPTATQVAGGVLVVGAIALIRWAEPPDAPMARTEP